MEYVIIGGRLHPVTPPHTEQLADGHLAAVPGDGWRTSYRNDGTGVITLDPGGTEQVNGETTLQIYPGEGSPLRSAPRPLLPGR